MSKSDEIEKARKDLRRVVHEQRLHLAEAMVQESVARERFRHAETARKQWQTSLREGETVLRTFNKRHPIAGRSPRA